MKILNIDEKLFNNIYNLTRFVVYDDKNLSLYKEVNNKRLIKYIDKFSNIGFKFNPLLLSFEDKEIDKIYYYLRKFYGYDRDLENTIFYESFKYVKEKDEIVLLLHQILHYITSYWIPFLETGQIDFINSEGVYYPPKKVKDLENLIYDKLNIDLRKEIHLISLKDFIKFFEKQFLYKNRAYTLMDLNLILNILEDLQLNVDINQIKNRELLVKLLKEYDNYNLNNINPDFILRYIIFSITGKSLVINSKRFRKELKQKSWNISKDELIKLFKPFVNNNKRKEFISHFKNKEKLWKIIHRKFQSYFGDNIVNDKDIQNIDHLFNIARNDIETKTFMRRIYDQILLNDGNYEKLTLLMNSPHLFLQNYSHFYHFYRNHYLDINNFYFIFI